MDEAAQDVLADEMTEALKTPTGTMRLRRLQALALYELGVYGGGFFPKGVGQGKTLTSFLAAYVLDAERPMLCLPASLIGKTEKELEEIYAPHWRLPPNIRLFSYEKFGLADYASELEKFAPDLLILDEAHNLKNGDAARTKRFSRYMEAHPNTKVVALSGTIMDHSILEFAPILRWCLKGSSPVPLSDSELNEWASALDVKAPRGNELARFDVGELVRLANSVPGLEQVKDDVSRARQGFRHRLVSTPGVVASFSGGETVNASIRIKGIVFAPTSAPPRDSLGKPTRPPRPGEDPTDDHFYRLRAEMKMTNDWDLSSPMEVWAHAREIALGLSYIWKTRPPEDWIQPRKAWFKFVRAALKESAKNGGELDSPHQVECAVLDGSLTGGAAYLKAWFDIRDSFSPETVPVWHDDLAINACVKWVKQSGPGLIWTEHTLFAQRLAEKTGLTYYGQKGLATKGEFINDANPGKSAIASIDANKEGRNLQKIWSRCLYTSPTSRPKDWQQSIGRFHRPGQEADEVHASVLIGCREHLTAWAALLPAAKAVEETTGEPQKVLLAGTPEYWPDEFDIASWTGARWLPPEVEDFDPVAAWENEREAA